MVLARSRLFRIFLVALLTFSLAFEILSVVLWIRITVEIECVSSSIQNTSMAANQIENIYNDLVSSMDREFRRLKQVLAEQEIKEEEERLKKIQVDRSSFSRRSLTSETLFA